MNVITRALASLKSLTHMQWGRSSSWFSMLLGATNYDYRSAAGDGRSNAAVMACVRWAQRTFPEAPVQVSTRNAQGELAPAPEHALQLLLDRPNPYYSGLHLVGALLADLMLTGNGYALKVRTGNGRVAELWWAPSSLVEPKWPDTDPSVYISHYEYTVEGDVIRLEPDDVIHVRQGFDPNNIRKGLSDLASLYREVASDNEAANWTASLLRNGAVPGVVISPELPATVSQPQLDSIKDEFMRRFGGDMKGAPLVLNGPTRVQPLSFNPQEMSLRDVRVIPEERITAVLGIPAIVVGLGAGLQRSTFANYAEAREAAYESFIIPMQRLLAAELQLQLVPDFGDPTRLRIAFDLSQVRVLQDDQNALHERTRADLLAGLLTLNQALGAVGEAPLTGPEGDVRYLPSTITVTPADRLIPPERPEITVLPPATPDDEEEPADGRRALAAAGARNGRHKAAALGPPLVLSDDDLDRLSRVTPDDLDSAERFWRQAVDGTGLEELLDAQPEERE